MKKTISAILSAAMLMSSFCMNITTSAAETDSSIYTTIDLSKKYNSTVYLSQSTAGTITDDTAKYPDFFIGKADNLTYKPYALSKESIDELAPNGEFTSNGIPFSINALDNQKSAGSSGWGTIPIPAGYYSAIKLLTVKSPNLGDENVYPGVISAATGKEIASGTDNKATVTVADAGEVAWAKVKADDTVPETKAKLMVETINIKDVAKTQIINGVNLWLQVSSQKRILAVTMVSLSGNEWNPIIAEKIAALPDSVSEVDPDKLGEVTEFIEKAKSTGGDVSLIDGIEKYNKLKTAIDNIYTTIDASKSFNSIAYLSKDTAGTITDPKSPHFFMSSGNYTYKPYALSKESIDEFAPDGIFTNKGIPYILNAVDNKNGAGWSRFRVGVPTGYYSAIKVLTVTSPNAGNANVFPGVISAATGVEIPSGASRAGSVLAAEAEWAKVKADDTLPTTAANIMAETINLSDTAKTQLISEVSLWLQGDSPKRILAVTMVGLKVDEWNSIIAVKIAALPDDAADLNQDDLDDVTALISKAEKCGADISSIEGIDKYNNLMTSKFNKYVTVDLSERVNAISCLSENTAGTITDDTAKYPNFFMGNSSSYTYTPYALSKGSLDSMMTDGQLLWNDIPFAINTADNQPNAWAPATPVTVPVDYYSQVKVLTVVPPTALGNNTLARAVKSPEVSGKANLVVETFDITDKTKLINAVSLWLNPNAQKRVLAVTMVELKGSEWVPVIEAKIAALPDLAADVDTDSFDKITNLIQRASDSGTNIDSITGIDKYNRLKAELQMFEIVDSCDSFYEDDYITFNVTFKAAVNASDVTKDNIVLQCGRKAVDYTLMPMSTDAGVASVRIMLKNTLSTDDSYQLKVTIPEKRRYDAVFSIPKPITAENVVLKNSSGEIIDRVSDISDEKVTFNAEINNNTYSSGKDVKIITAAYNKNVLYAAKITDAQIDWGDLYDLNVQMNVPTEGLDENWTTAVYTWADDGITPLTVKKDKTYGIDALNDSTKDLTVAFIGGSITEGGNYTTPFIEKWQADRTGKITAINAGIGGTDSSYGAMRLYQDVLKKKPDIVFVEFTLNDAWLTEAQIKKNVEGMIRQAYESEHQPVISFIYIPDRRTNSDGSYVISKNIGYYSTALAYYGLTGFNAHQIMLDAIAAGGYTWDSFVASNNVHPDKTQGENIATLMYDDFKKNNAQYVKNIEWKQEKGFGADDYGMPLNLASANAEYDSNWSNTKIDGVVTEGYGVPASLPFESFMASATADSTMTFKFIGTKLAITSLMSSQGRNASYTITNADGEIERSGVLSTYLEGYGSWFEGKILSVDGLEDTEHTLTITLKSGSGLFGIGELWIDE